MIGAGAVHTFPLGSLNAADALLNVLSAGSAVSGRIVPEGAGLVVALPQLRLPLPSESTLTAGMRVEVRLIEENGAKSVQIQPRALEPGPIPPTSLPRNASATILGELLSHLPVSVSREHAATLLPRTEGLPRETLRALLGLLVGRERIGAAIGHLSEAIDAAVASGRLHASVRESFAAIARGLLAENAADFERALLAARATLSGRASVSATPSAANSTLLDELLAIREQVVTGSGSPGDPPAAVLRALDALVDRIDAGRAQNLRGFETPYQFIEIPLASQSGLDRAQVHFFGDESRAVADNRAHSVVLDLELSQLGPVWVALHAVGRACSCTMRVASDAARDLLTNAAPDLEHALNAAGYAGATVRAEPWDGDRVSALAAMASRFTGFEVKA